MPSLQDFGKLTTYRYYSPASGTFWVLDRDWSRGHITIRSGISYRPDSLGTTVRTLWTEAHLSHLYPTLYWHTDRMCSLAKYRRFSNLSVVRRYLCCGSFDQQWVCIDVSLCYQDLTHPYLRAVMSDVVTAAARGRVMAAFTVGPFAGPAIAPLISGWMDVAHVNWKWVFWFQTILAAVSFAFSIVAQPETYKYVSLDTRLLYY